MNNRIRYVAGICGLALTAGMLTVPAVSAAEDAPTCQTRVADATAAWSMKESYLRYLHTIAGGQAELTGGITITDPKKGPIVFPVSAQRSVIESATKGVFALDGTASFRGHELFGEWRLQQDLSDWKVSVDGKSGQIFTDYRVEKRLFGTTSYTANDTAVANIVWKETPDLTAGTLDLSSAQVTLTKKGADEMFVGQYNEGDVIAPIHLTGTLRESCGDTSDTTPTPTPTTTPEPVRTKPVGIGGSVSALGSSDSSSGSSKGATGSTGEGSTSGGGMMRAVLIALGLGSVVAALAAVYHFFVLNHRP